MPLPDFKTEHAPGIRLPHDQQAIDSVHARLRAYHKGIDNAVLSPRIEAALNISGPKLRAIVNYLNAHGVPVASCGRGYFYAADNSELRDYIEQLESRVHGVQNRINGLRPLLK